MSRFNIGDIVSLNTHPYFENLDSIIFSGEPQLISPLMVVVEQVVDTKTNYDEKTGRTTSEEGKSQQCKCLWYSTKIHKFEGDWISSNLLKKITQTQTLPSLTDKQTLVGKLVILKTADIEIRKKKRSLSFENNSEIGRSIINPLLPFVSPVLQIIQANEVKKADLKEAIYDSQNGKQKRFVSEVSVKCKWFNPHTEKFSEEFFPIDAFYLLPTPNISYLNSLEEGINAKQFLKNDVNILKPVKIIYRNGIYYLSAFDYLLNRIEDFNINKNADLISLKSYSSYSAPFFDPMTGQTLSVIDCVKKGLSEKKYLRILYEKKNGTIISRTLKDYMIEEKENSKKVLTDYLFGYCLTRKASRTFTVKRIKKAEILDLNF